MKWKAWIAIVFILTIVLFNITWAWSVLFMTWVIPDIFSGRTHLFEEVKRKESPITYWAIIALWISISSYMLIDQFAPDLLPDTWKSSYYTESV